MKALVAILLSLLLHPGWSQTLKIYHFDVGQGASTLFVSYDAANAINKSVLFDGGLKRAGNGVLTYIKSTLGISKIDYIIASHYDSDHIGGLVYVMQNAAANHIVIDSVLDRGSALSPPSSRIYSKYRSLAAGYKYKVMTPGHVLNLLGSRDISIKCVAVNGKILKAGGTEDAIVGVATPDENDLCIALIASYGKFRYANGGDIGGRSGSQPGTCDGPFGCGYQDIETSVAANHFPVSAFSVNHHGARCSSNNEWITASKSPVAIISSGQNAKYQHPRQEVLDLLGASVKLKKYFMTASVNYYSRNLGTKGVLNATAGVPVTLIVPAVTNGKSIQVQSNFTINGTNYTFP